MDIQQPLLCIHKQYCVWIIHKMWQNMLQQKKPFNSKPLEDLLFNPANTHT